MKIIKYVLFLAVVVMAVVVLGIDGPSEKHAAQIVKEQLRAGDYQGLVNRAITETRPHGQWLLGPRAGDEARLKALRDAGKRVELVRLRAATQMSPTGLYRVEVFAAGADEPEHVILFRVTESRQAGWRLLLSDARQRELTPQML